MKLIGFDIGTGNLIASYYDETDDKNIVIEKFRNVYLPVEPSELIGTEFDSNIDYAESKDRNGNIEKYYVLGEDALRLCNIFGKEISRPMKSGVISPSDIDSIDVISSVIRKMIDKTKKGLVVYSVPEQPLDSKSPPVGYHERMFKKIFNDLGYKSVPLNEGTAIVYSECSTEEYSGIGISFGAGLVNISSCYKGIPTIKFSLGRSGDWVDEEVARSVDSIPNKITAIKENKLDLSLEGINQTKSKKEFRILEALYFYYENLIDYIIKKFIEEFKNRTEDMEINESIPIVLSGGTSLPKGFKEMFETVFEKYREDFPYDISEIRLAKDPLNSVTLGCLIYSEWYNKKNN